MIRHEHRELARQLAAFPAFVDCSPEDLLALARAGQCLPVPAHWTLIHERTPADACYVLLEGELHVRRHGAEVNVLWPGAVLGEMGLLRHDLRTASVVSAVPVRVLRVDYPAMAALLLARPRLSACLGAVYAEHCAAPSTLVGPAGA